MGWEITRDGGQWGMKRSPGTRKERAPLVSA